MKTQREFTLDDLLADPMVRDVMRADRVHPGRLGRELRALSSRLGGRDSRRSDGRDVIVLPAPSAAACCEAGAW